jgi:hypothetical protein
MWFLSVHQHAIAVRRHRCCIALYLKLSEHVTAPTKRKTERLVTVSPDVDEFLALVALRLNNLSFVCLYSYGLHFN